MSLHTKIEWTDATWNVAIGCTKVSEGCKYCYMMRDFGPGSFKGKKDKETGEPIPVNGTVTRTQPSTFNKPLIWQKQGLRCIDGSPLKVFTSSLTDIFHEAIDSYRYEIWDIIRKCPDLIFQILTKRPERIADNLPDDWGEGYDNVWLGITAENQEQYNHRMAYFAAVPSKVRFVSFEPLLGKINIGTWGRLTVEARSGKTGSAFDWAIIGGESGNKTGKWLYRPCELHWMKNLIEQLEEFEIATFVKQLGTHLKDEFKKWGYDTGKAGGDILDLPSEYDYLKVRQFPEYAMHKL